MTKVISVIIWFGIGALVGFNLCVLSVVFGATYTPVLNTMVFFGILLGALRVCYFAGLLK